MDNYTCTQNLHQVVDYNFKIQVPTHEIITIRPLHIDKLDNTEMCTYF